MAVFGFALLYAFAVFYAVGHGDALRSRSETRTGAVLVAPWNSATSVTASTVAGLSAKNLVIHESPTFGLSLSLCGGSRWVRWLPLLAGRLECSSVRWMTPA